MPQIVKRGKMSEIEKPDQNWTKFPNCILDNLEKFTSSELHVLSLMIRKNIGYDNPNKKFSISYISAKTGLSTSTVKTCCKSLIEKNSIKIIGNAERGINLYDIKWTEPTWTKSDLVKNKPSTRLNNNQEPSQNLTTVLENKVQDNEVKENINQAKPESITTQIKYLFDKGNMSLFNEKLSWVGKEKEYGINIQRLIKASENDIDKIRTRAEILFKKIKNKEFMKGSGFTPSTLLSNWNELLPVKQKMFDKPETYIPTEEEIRNMEENAKYLA